MQILSMTDAKMDYSKPIEIAPNIFWVGYVIPNDPFQCHVYLIKNGKESILIDPGSMITFPVVLEKITSILKLRDIKYIIMHHQDPDIVGCYSTLETLFPKGERYIVTHWRTQMLLKHYQWKTPFYLIDKHNWQLKAGEREFEFVFTPYAHFPGAFCTYDKESGIVFSSDLFGGLSDEFNLFAKSADEYFEAVKPFHKHYMPSREILNYALKKVKEKNPSMIAPQHGSIIKKEFIDPLIDKMKELECGVYMLDDYESDILILNAVDEVLKKFFRDTVSLSSFEVILKNLFHNIKEILPSVYKIEFCGISPLSRSRYCFDFEDDRMRETNVIGQNYSYMQDLVQKDEKIGAIYVWSDELSELQKRLIRVLFDKISVPIAVSLQKELMLKELENQNKILYKRSITDSLTGLYNRNYLNSFLKRRVKEAREYNLPLSVAIIDIDFFKKVNDTYGHLIGDCVLRELSNLLREHFRSDDIVARYGGEEIVVVLPFATKEFACKRLEEVREKIANHLFCGKNRLHISVSIGVAEFEEGDDVERLIKKADNNLYKAKEAGRNRVVCD